VEELGAAASIQTTGSTEPHSSNNGKPRLRDQLCQLIRRHDLQADLVKRYAADFCGAENLRDVSRELIESFVETLAGQAEKDRPGLICLLNSYSRVTEVIHEAQD